MNGMEKNYRTEKVFASFFSGYVPFFGVIILYNEEEKGRACMSEKVYINIFNLSFFLWNIFRTLNEVQHLKNYKKSVQIKLYYHNYLK